MPGVSGEQLQEPGRGRRYRRLVEALSSPDSYGLVLLLILLTYALTAGLSTSSWAGYLVVAVQIATVWVTLRASQARRSARTIANVALAAAALAAVVGLFFHDEMQHGRIVSWVSCLLYLIAPVSIVRHLVLQANRGQPDSPGSDRRLPDGRDVLRIPLPRTGAQSDAAARSLGPRAMARSRRTCSSRSPR